MKLLSILLLFISTSSFASEPCTDWPSIRYGWGPSLASTGLPLTYNIRLHCEAREFFELKRINGEYVNDRGEAIVPATPVYKAQLNNDEVLYQVMFIVPGSQAPGIYRMLGCVEIEDVTTGEVRCIELPPSPMDIVFVPKD